MRRTSSLVAIIMVILLVGVVPALAGTRNYTHINCSYTVKDFIQSGWWYATTSEDDSGCYQTAADVHVDVRIKTTSAPTYWQYPSTYPDFGESSYATATATTITLQERGKAWNYTPSSWSSWSSWG